MVVLDGCNEATTLLAVDDPVFTMVTANVTESPPVTDAGQRLQVKARLTAAVTVMLALADPDTAPEVAVNSATAETGLPCTR
jgi:hypothetical protein